MNNETTGERVKRLRDARGWTQQQLADKAGVAQSTINGVEKGGRQKMPSSLIEISHALGVDAYWLKTGRGHRLGGESITPDEQTLLDGFRLLGEEMREAWLDQARKKIAQAEAVKNQAA